MSGRRAARQVSGRRTRCQPRKTHPTRSSGARFLTSFRAGNYSTRLGCSLRSLAWSARAEPSLKRSRLRAVRSQHHLLAKTLAVLRLPVVRCDAMCALCTAMQSCETVAFAGRRAVRRPTLFAQPSQAAQVAVSSQNRQSRPTGHKALLFGKRSFALSRRFSQLHNWALGLRGEEGWRGKQGKAVRFCCCWQREAIREKRIERNI